MVHCNHPDMSPIYDVNYPIMIRWTIAVTFCWLQAEDQEQRYGEAAVNQCQHVGSELHASARHRIRGQELRVSTRGEGNPHPQVNVYTNARCRESFP